jgi:hypothetical protein
LLPLLVALDHRQLFCHVDREEILRPQSSIPARQIWRVAFHQKIAALDKSERRDAVLDPVGEVSADLQEGVQVASVDGLSS